MGLLYILLFWITTSVLVELPLALNITGQVGDNIRLPCNDSNGVYPVWFGPGVNGSSLLYTYSGSSEFSPHVPNGRLYRLQWDTTDNRSLIVTNVSRLDSGVYTCRNFEPIDLLVRVLSEPVISNAERNDTHVYTIYEREDRALNLTCSTTSYPQPSLKWYKYANKTGPLISTRSLSNLDDGFINVTETFTIMATREEDRIEYVCEAAFDSPNPVSRAVTVVLDLILRPAQPVLAPNHVTENVQSDVAMCVTSGFKPVDIQIWWELNGENYTGSTKVIEDIATFTFNVTSIFSASLTRDNNGRTLKCVIVHDSLAAPLTASTNISVLFQPEYATLTGQTTGLTADGVTKLSLSCTSDASNPTPNITWIVRLTTVMSNSTTTETPGQHNAMIVSQKLELVADRTLDQTDVYCLVHNHMFANPTKSNVKLIELFYHPEVTITGPTEVVEFEAHIPPFRCTADANPLPQFTWFHNGKEIHDHIDFTGNVFGYSLTSINTTHSNSIVVTGNVSKYSLTSIDRTHAGNYTCVANNGYDPVGSTTVKLTVKCKALIDSFTQVPENKQLKLRCFVDSFPPANLTIVKEGHVLASTINNNILEYMVDGFDCLASGTYICQGFNGYNGEEPDSSSIHITTKCLPRSLRQVDIGTNNLNKLEVTVLAYPEPSIADVEWSKFVAGEWRSLKGGYVIPVTQNTFICGLNLSDMTQQAFGYYRVYVQNGLNGTLTQIFHVESEETTESSTNGVLWYSVSSSAGVVVGIIFACTCMYIRNKCAGGDERGTFDCFKGRPTDTTRDSIYEEIGASVNTSGNPQNVYSDLNTAIRTNESSRDANKTVKATHVQAQEKGDMSSYIDMSGTLSHSSGDCQEENSVTESQYMTMTADEKDIDMSGTLSHSSRDCQDENSVTESQYMTMTADKKDTSNGSDPGYGINVCMTGDQN